MKGDAFANFSAGTPKQSKEQNHKSHKVKTTSHESHILSLLTLGKNFEKNAKASFMYVGWGPLGKNFEKNAKIYVGRGPWLVHSLMSP